ncbi:cytochrome c oxidase assembly protein [Roseitranquillus sediminis]|uniref:cytochrome c oxidase assembly protein n=1 Tax=Roseitranquillus sediminis TaxID=2809051 RepID=UPI001D0C971B|nr:cytochrome c oxidase assembly protein [Roseitranquillus sediminis]MBM9593011.1 cytochrome c oxidase assembly protein [Roseitranquillus sediminis]
MPCQSDATRNQPEPERRLRRHWPLAASLVLLTWLWLGPMPELARISFSAHMALHLSVMLLAAPLVALGLARLGTLPPRGPWLAVALAAGLAELVVVWGWHVPVLHESAAMFPRIFAIQQASFLAAGVLVWLPGLAGSERRAAAAGMLAMLMGFMHMSVLGVLLTLAPRLIYSPDVCQGILGLGPLDDQRLGGLMMAVGGGLPYLLGILHLGARFLREPEVAG